MTEKEYPHGLVITDKLKKELERAAALLSLEDWYQALSLGGFLAREYAEAHVKGNTAVFFCTSGLKTCIENNPAFFEALCQEGVIEWLTPFVMGKFTTPPEENQ